MWEMPPWVRVFRSYDHGYWPDPAVCLWIAVVGRQLIVFKEIVRYRMIAKDLAAEILAESRGMHIVATYCDPTLDIKTGADVQTIKGTFEANGVPMECSVNNREHYAHAINSALKTELEPGVPRLLMYQRGAPYLTKSLPQMRYDEKNPQAMADHKHDHAPIALAYFLMSYSANYTNTMPELPSKLMPWMKSKKGMRKPLGIRQVKSLRAKLWTP